MCLIFQLFFSLNFPSFSLLFSCQPPEKTLQNSPTFIIKHFSKLGQCRFLGGINLICFRMSVGTRQYGYSYSQSQASYLPRVGDILRATLLLAQPGLLDQGKQTLKIQKLVEILEKLWNITFPFLYWGH